MILSVDLTPLLSEARQFSSRWSKDKVRQAAKCILQHLRGTTLDWDEWAGEEWARVLLDRTVLALIHVQTPLVFMLATYLRKDLASELSEIGSHTVSVDDFEEKHYKVDQSRLKEVFPGKLWPSDAIDPEKLSIFDLWWATV